MDVPYPKNIVWYIEARPWNGSKAQPGFAPADPSSMGSAVAVQLEHLDQDGNPFQPAKIRQYLLTCGHVVRQAASNADAGWGPFWKKFIVGRPAKATSLGGVAATWHGGDGPAYDGRNHHRPPALEVLAEAENELKAKLKKR